MTDRRQPCRVAVLVLVVGLSAIGLYYLLGALEVGNFGAPSDIGGGLVLLLGVITAVIGVVMVVYSIRRPATPAA